MTVKKLTAEQVARVDFVMQTVVLQYGIDCTALTCKKGDDEQDRAFFARCMVTVILKEEGFKMPQIGRLMGRSRISMYSILRNANNLLGYHAHFKKTYLKVIQIITADEN